MITPFKVKKKLGKSWKWWDLNPWSHPTGVHLGQKWFSRNWIKMVKINSQGVGKFHPEVSFWRKKEWKKLWVFKVLNPQPKFLAAITVYLVTFSSYSSTVTRGSGMPLISGETLCIRELKYIKFSSWPLVAHGKKWIWKFFFFSKNVKKWKIGEF